MCLRCSHCKCECNECSIVEKYESCCVSDSCCDYPAGDYQKSVLPKCFSCGLNVCYKCSSYRKCFPIGLERICNNCALEKFNESFIDKCLNKEISVDQIHNFIDLWHQNNSKLILSDFLGMTSHEYDRFIESDDELEVMLKKRKQSI